MWRLKMVDLGLQIFERKVTKTRISLWLALVVEE